MDHECHAYLVLGEMSRELFSALNRTASPKSAMTAVPSFLTSMLRDLMSRCAMAGLPRLPEISVWRWLTPQAMECASLGGGEDVRQC